MSHGPIYLWQLIYQAKTDVVNLGAKETVSEDRWHQPWSDPPKPKAGLGAHLQQFQPYEETARFPEVVSEDRWHQPWSEPPVKTKAGLPAAEQQFLAPSPQPFVSFSWFNELSKPSELRKPGLSASAQQALVLTDPFPFVSFSWFNALSEPVRLALRLITGANPDEFFSESARFPEIVSEDRWHQPWSEPVRRATATALQSTTTFTAVVTATPTTPTVDGWGTALSTPQRQLLGLAAQQQQFLAFSESAQFPESVSEDRWHEPWTEPVRIKPAAQQQQTTAFDPAVFVASVDGWWSPFAEVPKPKAGTIAACQQFFAFDPAVFVSAPDAWAQSWSDPPKPKVGVTVAAQQALAFDPAVFTPSVDGWQNAFSDPVRPRPTVTAEAIFFPPNFSTATVPNFGYFTPFSEPQRQLAGLAARMQQFEADGFVPIVPPFVWFFGNEEPLPWPGYRSNQFIRENYDSFALPPFPIPNPPQTQAKFTVSGPSVSDLFPVSGVVYPYAPETRKTVP